MLKFAKAGMWKHPSDCTMSNNSMRKLINAKYYFHVILIVNVIGEMSPLAAFMRKTWVAED